MVIASPRYSPVGSKLSVKLNACSQPTLYVPPLPPAEPPLGVPDELFDEPPPHAARTQPERTATETSQSFRIQPGGFPGAWVGKRSSVQRFRVADRDRRAGECAEHQDDRGGRGEAAVGGQLCRREQADHAQRGEEERASED